MQNLGKYNLQEEFFNHLQKNGVSRTTLKNYKSDLKHFVSFISKQIVELGIFANELEGVVPFLTTELYFKYKKNQIVLGTATKTLNRRLSTLRSLSKFLLRLSLINFDPSPTLKNVSLPLKPKPPQENKTSHLLSQFKNHLISQNISQNTIKNYLSDVKQFFSWVETKDFRSKN